MKDNVYFVSGIDTNIGKSYATGFIARTWNSEGRRTITQKLIQTGNTGMSEDIELHRRIMGCGLLPEDREGLTMPEITADPQAADDRLHRMETLPADLRHLRTLRQHQPFSLRAGSHPRPPHPSTHRSLQPLPPRGGRPHQPRHRGLHPRRARPRVAGHSVCHCSGDGIMSSMRPETSYLMRSS